MKISIYLLIILFILNACQGRGLPFHPSAPKTFFEHNSKTLDKHANLDTPSLQKDNHYPTLKLKEKSLEKQKNILSKIPIVNKLSDSTLSVLHKIPIVKDVLPKGSKISNRRLGKKFYINNVKSFSGGTPIDGLDIGMVRLGQSHYYTRLIFDSYKWEGYAQTPIEKVNDSGTYLFTYEPSKKRIVGILDGYQAFSALVGDHSDLYKGNTMVKTIHIDEYLDKSGFKFTIELKQEAQVNVYELHNPARIVIDLAPLQ